jgi:DNA invertase Pin-like site-specific DNA recombinase
LAHVSGTVAAASPSSSAYTSKSGRSRLRHSWRRSEGRSGIPQRALQELRQARERRDAEIRQLVAKALRRGARTQDIADALKISRSTFWRRYTDQLRRDEQPKL